MSRARRGAAALTVALSVGVVFAVVALVVDLGLARVAQGQLQAATDAGALAGARVLDGTEGGLTEARATAVSIAAANRAMGVAVAVDDNPGNTAEGGVVLGIWDDTTTSFSPSLDPKKVNAVAVRARREDLPTWFAVLLGRDTLTAASTSMASRGRDLGAGRVPYYLPFALPICQTEGHTPGELDDLTFTLSPAGADNVGWGAIGTAPNTAWVRDHVDEMLPCMHQWAEDGTVDEACSEAAVGDSVNLSNGTAEAALQAINDAMADGIPWDSDTWGALPAQHAGSTVGKKVYGTVLVGPIPIFDGSAAYCSGKTSWNETLPLAGFVWGAIYDVRAKGSAVQKNVWVRVDLSHLHPIGEWYGGGEWGVTYDGPPVLRW